MPKDACPSMDTILRDVAKKYDVTVGALSHVVEPTEALTTGNIAIDSITGIGGLPIGRVTELYGEPSSGKSTVALQTAAELQKRIIAGNTGEHILYMDYEHTLDEDYCAGLGLDVEHPSFLLAQPYWLEQGAEAARKIIDVGSVRLSIWDSIAEMTPKSTLDAEFDRRTGAMERARQMKELCARLTPLIHQRRCAAVFLNHMVTGVDMAGARPGMPPPETTPGGKAVKFYASLRMSFKQMGQIRADRLDPLTGEMTKQIVAVDTKVKVTKNKLANPFREAKVRVRFGQGFDNVWTALEILRAHKHIMLGSAGYHFFDKAPDLVHSAMTKSATGRPQIHGEPAVLRFADAHPEWREKLIRFAAQVVDEQGDAKTDDDPFDGEDDGVLE